MNDDGYTNQIGVVLYDISRVAYIVIVVVNSDHESNMNRTRIRK